MANCLKSEPKLLQRSVKMVCSIDGKACLLDRLFVAEFLRKQHSELCGSGLKQSDVEELVSLGIDSGVQPVSFVVNPNHRLV